MTDRDDRPISKYSNGDNVKLIHFHNDFLRFSSEMYSFNYKILNKKFKFGNWVYQLEYTFKKGVYEFVDVLNDVWQDEIERI